MKKCFKPLYNRSLLIFAFHCDSFVAPFSETFLNPQLSSRYLNQNYFNQNFYRWTMRARRCSNLIRPSNIFRKCSQRWHRQLSRAFCVTDWKFENSILTIWCYSMLTNPIILGSNQPLKSAETMAILIVVPNYC